MRIRLLVTIYYLTMKDLKGPKHEKFVAGIFTQIIGYRGTCMDTVPTGSELETRPKIFILQALFQSAQHLYEKREGSGSIPLTNGSGRLKNMRIPNTVFITSYFFLACCTLPWLFGNCCPRRIWPQQYPPAAPQSSCDISKQKSVALNTT
jgi:hypothetical protein